MRVRLFLSRLHAHILKGGRCFTSGTFVVEVPDSPRFATFVRQLQKFSSRRPFAKTHDWFQSQRKFASQRLCKDSCPTNARWLTADRQREYAFKPPLVGLCGSGNAAPKGVMLWYTFRVGSKRYMFMKLESAPALSAQHAWGAVRRYVLKTKKKSSLPSRRENAGKNSRGTNLGNKAARLSANNVRTLWPSSEGNARKYNRNVRTGLEMFVPSAMANRF